MAATTETIAATPTHEATQPNTLIAKLQATAENESRSAFVDLVESIDWPSRTPEELREALDLSLSLDMVPLARELANLGTRLFPENKILSLAAYVIAPPQVVGTRPAENLGLRASRKWLVENSVNYKGQWLAVREGKLLGVASTLKKLHESIGTENRSPATIVVKALY